MATMESLIGLVNRIQRACTALGDYGGADNAFSSLWDALPSVAVVGGQVYFLFYIILYAYLRPLSLHFISARLAALCVCEWVLI